MPTLGINFTLFVLLWEQIRAFVFHEDAVQKFYTEERKFLWEAGSRFPGAGTQSSTSPAPPANPAVLFASPSLSYWLAGVAACLLEACELFPEGSTEADDADRMGSLQLVFVSGAWISAAELISHKKLIALSDGVTSLSWTWALRRTGAPWSKCWVLLAAVSSVSWFSFLSAGIPKGRQLLKGGFLLGCLFSTAPGRGCLWTQTAVGHWPSKGYQPGQLSCWTHRTSEIGWDSSECYFYNCWAVL